MSALKAFSSLAEAVQAAASYGSLVEKASASRALIKDLKQMLPFSWSFSV